MPSKPLYYSKYTQKNNSKTTHYNFDFEMSTIKNNLRFSNTFMYC